MDYQDVFATKTFRASRLAHTLGTEIQALTLQTGLEGSPEGTGAGFHGCLFAWVALSIQEGRDE